MAMFVLRLSGLLSLERAANDTSGPSAYQGMDYNSSDWSNPFYNVTQNISNDWVPLKDPWERSYNNKSSGPAKLVLPSKPVPEIFEKPSALAIKMPFNQSEQNRGLEMSSPNYPIHEITTTERYSVSDQTDNPSPDLERKSNQAEDVDNPNIKGEEAFEPSDEIIDIAEQLQVAQELKGPPPDFVASDFEYYDFNAERKEIHVPHSLTSHNLVSPVPYPKPNVEKPPIESRGDVGVSESDSLDAITTSPKSEENVTLSSISTDQKRKVVQPVMVDQSLNRNNPYPYGPVFLPGYAGVSAPSVPVTERPTSSTTSTPTVKPDFVQPPDEYEYQYEEYDYKDSVQTVKTDKPPVLFHFEGPGYAPEAPSTKPPPVRVPTPSDPWDCGPRCPNYTLEDWNPFYDVRRYPKLTWLSTIIISKDRVLAELEGYMRLQDYFFGLNDRGQILNLSVPFITQIKQGRHPGVISELNDYTISLHIPPGMIDHNYGLPAPISNEVLIDNLEPKTVFVSSFEVDVWEVTGEFLEKKAQMLMSKLRSNGEAFIDRYYYLASYSRPELYQPVYYEIWIYATSLRNPSVPMPEPMPRPRMPPLSQITKETLQRLCRGVECPSFEVVRSYKYGIQKRRYFDVVFASVSTGECYFSTLSVWKGFMPLHLYKHGINSHMEVVEATRPIAVVKVKEDSTPNNECPQNLTMSLFLPRRLHSAPPVTGYTAPGPVIITALDDVMVYAYTVGGYLMDPNRVRQELSDFKYRLSEFGACFRDDVYYIVIYDFISRYHGRQNEIWIVAENCRATQNG